MSRFNSIFEQDSFNERTAEEMYKQLLHTLTGLSETEWRVAALVVAKRILEGVYMSQAHDGRKETIKESKAA